MNIEHKRQGQMDTAICYFYTDTISEFRPLLTNDELKMVCINPHWRKNSVATRFLDAFKFSRSPDRLLK